MRPVPSRRLAIPPQVGPNVPTTIASTAGTTTIRIIVADGAGPTSSVMRLTGRRPRSPVRVENSSQPHLHRRQFNGSGGFDEES